MACGLRRTSTFSPLTNASVLPLVHVKTLGIHNCYFEAVPHHFRVRDHPYGLQDSLPTLNPSCSLHLFIQLRHGSKARYGWVANPSRNSLLSSSLQGLSPCKIRRALLGTITTEIRLGPMNLPRLAPPFPFPFPSPGLTGWTVLHFIRAVLSDR